MVYCSNEAPPTLEMKYETYVAGAVAVLCPLFVGSGVVVDFCVARLYGLRAAVAGEVEKDCDEMEFRL